MPPIVDSKQQFSRTARAAAPDPGLTPGDIVRMLRGHWAFILVCTLVCVSGSIVYARLYKPVYEADAILRIDPSRASSLGMSDPGAVATNEPSDPMQTEIVLLHSDVVAFRTLNALPEEDFYQFTGEHKAAVAFPAEMKALTPKQQGIIDYFTSETRAKQVEGTQLISVGFRSNDPHLAARLVNQLVAAYTVQTFVDRDNSVMQLRTWLSAQMAALKDQVDQSQGKLASFQENNDFVATEGSGNTITDRLRILNERLATAQHDRILKQAQLQSARSRDAATLSTLFPDARLDALERELTTVTGKIAQLSAKFGPTYQPLVELQNQQRTLRADIDQNVQSVRNRLQQEYDSARSAENMLQSQYNEQTHLAYGFNRNQAAFTALQADVASKRELYNTLEKKLEQAGVDAEVSGLNTMLVHPAPVPTKAVEPNRPLIIGSGLVLGLFAGIAVAILFDATSDKLRTSRDIVKTFGYQPIASIPASKGDGDGELDLPVLNAASSPAAEAYRTLRNIFLLGSEGKPAKSFLVTSALSGEGANEVAANYAVALAQAGYRVLLVDADLREPSLHGAFGLENRSGLRDLLKETPNADAAPQLVAKVKNLFVLAAGSAGSGVADELIRGRLKTLLQEWEARFDFVVLQSSALLEVSDGLVVASAVKATLVVARYKVSRPRALAHLHTMLEQVDVQVAGVVVKDLPNAGAAYAA
ncbi:MAG TPA: polysaccharide biosynthesis tyrosine autokinase [Acidobacteriaceae bacterium]|jgi:capsular exopolysaccharide synthesis family protein